MQEMISANVEKRTVRENLEVPRRVGSTSPRATGHVTVLGDGGLIPEEPTVGDLITVDG